MTDIQWLPIDRLYPHPDNPRLQLRDDVVERLTAEIRRHEFRPEHAILVRPYDTGWQIVSGHHRVEAAGRAGLAEVPAWVRDMDDDEAFMQLVLGNTQGELSPLEIGMHALKAVPLAEGGRGKKGGLSEYAERVGWDKSYVSLLRSAAQVADTVDSGQRYQVMSLAKHLYEISKAPRESWPALVTALVDHEWTVADTRRKVQEIARYQIPEHHADWLPLADVIAAYLETGRPTSSAAAKLVATVDGILDHIDREGTGQDAANFRQWLVQNRGSDAWDHRALAKYHADLIVEWSERDADTGDPRIKIYECRARDLLQHVEPGSVDLIFTDPPYPAEHVDCWSELGELAVKALKPGGLLVAYSGQYTLPEALDRLRAAGLTYFWMYAVEHDGAFFRMNATHVQCGWKPLLVFRNGPGDPPNWHKDIVTDGRREKSVTATGGEFDGGTWQQSEAEAAYWISELSAPDALICDPFVGSGTTAVVARNLGRRFIGCDIDPKATQHTRERLA